VILAYFLCAAVWASYMQYDVRRHRDHQILFDMGHLAPTERFAHIGLGAQDVPIALSRRLTSGHLTVVDIYNPQLSPGADVARMRTLYGPPPKDPRITWLDGSFDLLPLPDGSVRAVTMNRTLGAIWQRGDQLCLLQEAYRILAVGGWLLLAERSRSETNTLVLGPSALRLPPEKYWRSLLIEAGFGIVDERTVHGLVHYWRAEKPFPSAHERLTFDFGIGP
jgi:ubiquinone/menaquinone biosynthesis C-methylase UbiE